MMPNSSIFLFQSEVHKDINSGDYNLYLFKDFTGAEDDIQKEIFGALSEIRKRIHSPETIYIICKNKELLDKEKIINRFVDGQAIKYIDYKDVTPDIFKHGILEIVTKSKVVQHAPHGTLFKKTSGAESNYFIKASLSLSEYPEICFLALALFHEITPKKLASLRKIYVDTSTIISLVQAVIYCCNMLQDRELNPQIINFKSYKQNDIDFNLDKSFTIISASSSGKLRINRGINSDKCLTLFYPKNKDRKEKCLFQLNSINSKPVPNSPILMSLTSEDFSLEYSKSKEVIIKKLEIERLDSGQLIKKLLGDEFKNISYNFSSYLSGNKNCIKFKPKYIYDLLEKNKFIDETFSRSLYSQKDNCIIYDFKNPKESLSNTKGIKGIEKNDFFRMDYENKDAAQGSINDKNIIVFLTQATSYELTRISQKLRKYTISNITYIIGALITDNYDQSKSVENNICFNDTPYKYNFYCYLNLPLSGVVEANIDCSYKLSNGFVFYDKGNATELHQKQVYLVISLILELLRSNGKLSDHISHHDVLSPKNFSRFNDSLLQLSLLYGSRGRDLNFHSNIELSREMKDVIMDLMKEKVAIGEAFIDALIEGQIKLTNDDFSTIKKKYPRLFIERNEI